MMPGGRTNEARRLADVFVSYTSSDRDWAFWTAKELEALGHTPHVHEWEIKAGGRAST
jgi:hypothetical protein